MLKKTGWKPKELFLRVLTNRNPEENPNPNERPGKGALSILDGLDGLLRPSRRKEDTWANGCGYAIVYAYVYGNSGKESGQEFGSLEHIVLQWMALGYSNTKAHGLHPCSLILS